jgi:FkbM family methyltransferase
MSFEINNFIMIESVYGKFVVNRHCAFQAEALVKTGRTHIEPELQILLAIADTLPDGAMVVDAGANIGLVSIPLAKALYARHGVVLAFELQRMIYYALCAGAALNDLENLFPYPHGLGAQIRDLRISKLDYGAPQDFGAFSLLAQGPERPEMIKILTLDSLGLPRLDLLKIDVEGMELEVLSGGRATIARGRPWCWIEHWKVGAEAIARTFDGMDYQCFVMDELNMICAPADKLARSGLAFDAPRV